MPYKSNEDRAAYMKRWKDNKRETDPTWWENVKKEKREHYQKNKERLLETATNWRLSNPEKRMLAGAKKRAKDSELEFDLDISDIYIPKVCPYLKTELNLQSTQANSRSTAPSLDRIDPSKGYVKGNVEVISHLANAMKQNATKDQLLEFSNTIIKRYGSTTKESSGVGRGNNDQREGQSVQSGKQTCNDTIEAGECTRCCFCCRSIP